MQSPKKHKKQSANKSLTARTPPPTKLSTTKKYKKHKLRQTKTKIKQKHTEKKQEPQVIIHINASTKKHNE